MNNVPVLEDRVPPQCLDVERVLLGSAITDKRSLSLVVDQCRVSDFYSTANQKVFTALSILYANQSPVDVVLLNAELKRRGDEEGICIIPELAECLAVPANIPAHINQLKEAAARRRVIADSCKAIEQAYNDDAPFEVSGPHQWENLVFTPSLDNCPADAKTLLELSGARLLSRGNIALLSALAGSGKSAVLEAACASLFNLMGDNLGLAVSAGSVLYVDTERSRHDFHCSWQRFLKRAGLTESPEKIRWENIRSIDRVSDRLAFLWSRLDRAGAPELVFIDGIGDFVKNVNDPDEVTPLVNRLLSVTDRRNIGILCTLHVNPGLASEKARGVLGSELWRKAESVLIIEKTPGDDARRLTTDYNLGKNRSGSDKVQSFFKWDDAEKMHVSCDKPAEVKGVTACDYESIVETMKDRIKWSFSDLRSKIMALTNKATRTAEQRIKDLLALERIVKNPDGTYSISEKQVEKPGCIHE